MNSGRFPPATLGLNAESRPSAVIDLPVHEKKESGLEVFRTIATVTDPLLPKKVGSSVMGTAGITARPIGISFLMRGMIPSYPWIFL